MAGSIKISIALYLAICVGSLGAQTDYDPETGLPIEPEETVQYDPVTGERLDSIEESTPIDPETGLPLRPVIVTEPHELKADKLNPAQPVAPGVASVVGFSRSSRSSLRQLAKFNARLHNPIKSWLLPAGMANIAGIGVGTLTGTLLIGGMTDAYFLGFIIGGVAGSAVVTASLGNTVKYAPVPEEVAAKPAADVKTYKKAYKKEAKRLRMLAAWSGTLMVASYAAGALLLTALMFI